MSGDRKRSYGSNRGTGSTRKLPANSYSLILRSPRRFSTLPDLLDPDLLLAAMICFDTI